jgi:hypothetical protein
VGQKVSVALLLDDGRSLELYPTQAQNRVYAEALKGANYRIRVRNLTHRRVGLCIAVDGRNIISGAKSYLGNDEGMYILDPLSDQTYEGWRTGQDRVNRFTFTSAGDSYAAAFGDTSAMGVVAVAVFAEVQRVRVPLQQGGPFTLDSAAPKACQKKEAKEEAGTGYGEEAYSPSRVVSFRAEAAPWEQTFIKYEWRETLKRLGVLREPAPANRFWNGPYAPPPPRGR